MSKISESNRSRELITVQKELTLTLNLSSFWMGVSQTLHRRKENMKKERKKTYRLGITMGDAHGIGPEIILKVFKDPRMFETIQPVVYGSIKALKYYRNLFEFQDYGLKVINSADEYSGRQVNVVNVGDLDKVEPGTPSNQSGKLAFESLKRATEDLAATKIDALITAPIDKDTIQSDEFKFPGHTEYLADMSNVEECLMLLMTDYLKVGVVTGHLPLKEVAAAISKEKIKTKANLLLESLKKDFGYERPKLAVLGLNPHAGDNGLLGSEEKEIINPAIRELKEEGNVVYGPYSADGFFGSDVFKSFDGVLAMYHDQGLIPFKALAFNEGVNYTAGLPIVRTSPDHGTAYAIAGKGQADETSMRCAIFTACDVVDKRKHIKEITENPLAVKA